MEEYMRFYILALMLIVSSIAFALNLDQCTTVDNRVIVSLNSVRTQPDLETDDSNRFITTKTFALPYQQASIQINSMTWNEYDTQGTFLRTATSIETDAVIMANSFTFREMQGFTVNVLNQITNNNTIKVLEQVEYEVVGGNPIIVPQEISPAFENAYRKLAANYDTSYLRNLPLSRPKLLIISHNSVTSYLGNFVAWKKAKGFEVFIENMENIGTTAIDIRDFVASHYQQYHCDYLLILGDSNGSYAVPTNIYTSPDGTEYDADDNFFTMVEGNDYFPELLVGRFSFGDLTELLVMTTKTISYEKTPFMTNTNWMRRALVVAGNYAEGGLRPVTPIWMSRWLREKMLAKGYAQVDTVFYPPTLTGAAAITASLNQGVQFVSYRGWGAADGWHYPSFHNQDLNNSIINYAKMPVVYSIVCNTGDFNNAVNPCFGEKWMRMGTISTLGGCIGFVGPSDLHTKTNLNNTISTGMFSSILDDGVRGFGESVLAGKVELYVTYPNDLASNGYVAFYYHVYNILSDPSLNMWMLVPDLIPASVITNGTTFSPSDSHIEINAANLDGAHVTATRDNINFTFTTVNNSVAIVPISPEDSGNVTVTITHPNHVPLVQTLTPSQSATIGITNNSMNDQVIYPGESYQVSLTIKNYSANAYNNIAANMTTSPVGLVTIQNASQTISSLLAGATTVLNYNITVSGSAPNRSIIRFNVAFPNQSATACFELLTGGPVFAVVTSQGNLTIGSDNTISFTLQNIGTFPIVNASVELLSSTNAASVVTPNISLGNIDVNASGTIQATIHIEANCYNGRNIPLVFIITNPAGYQTICFYALTAGNPTVADPTGPDYYGYFAYGSNDVSYPQAPGYNWVEIDPEHGGPGDASVRLIMDDGSYTIALPFTFRYYGVDYDSLTVCSNGWASFVTTWMADFNNLYIPAALGPYAMVAPYWDDLKGMKTGEDSLGSYFADMRLCSWYDQANNRLIVEWNDAYSQYNIDLMQGASLEKFQMILYPRIGEDGDIVYQYHTIDNPAVTSNYSTVGIENHLQNGGLTYTYANIYPVTATPLQAGLAIKFTTTAPDNYVANDDSSVTPVVFSLGQNYPNPFNPLTKISFNIGAKTNVRLDIFNLKGQKIRTLQNGMLAKGTHELTWDGNDDNGFSSASGVYIYRLSTGTETQTRKMVLMK
jgi:flagellar hook assembly protein FlgD